ncbi:MAG: hypothetical protein RL038_308 [Actinomycetota bacterium]
MSYEVSNDFGGATADGSVFVKTPNGDVAIGQYTIGTPAEGLDFFVKKYEGLIAEAELEKSRLQKGQGRVETALELVERLETQLTSPSVVGDLAKLAEIAGSLRTIANVKAAERAAAKKALRQEALVKREAIAVEAESLANSTAWKATAEKFAELLEQWKALPRGDRDAEQAIWKRFSSARQTFDRARRNHFAELSKNNSAAKSAKSQIVETAEALADSTDWFETTNKFRDLMSQWKASPRGNRKDEDALWNRFRAAQEKFFDAKRAADAIKDKEFEGNLEVKLAILVEAEALLPITNIAAAKSAMREISERWHKAGHVPRAELPKVEARLKKVEKAIAEAEAEEWRKNDPSRKQFASETANRFQASIDKIEAELAAAKAANSPKVKSLEEQLTNAKAMLETLLKHA